MTTHVRKQVRDQVVGLVTGLSTTGSKVYQNRNYPLSVSELPCLIVRTGDEQVQYLTIHNAAMQQRVMQVIISVIAEAISGLDDAVDDICKQVETALAGTVSLTESFILESTTGIQPNVVGEKPVGLVDITFLAQVTTLENAPYTIL